MSTDYYSIAIDCAPGTPRPDTHFKALCREINMSEDEFEPPSKCFGEWTWRVKPESVERYKAENDKTGKFLKDLYNRGCIRYADW